MVQITKKEMLDKYGIDLPKGKYYIEEKENKYNIYTIKDDTSGCILVGHNNVKGKVTESKVTFEDLMTELHMALQKGEKIHISIK